MRSRPDNAEAIGTALGSLDRAQVSTIHAFCQAIVRMYAPEAGVDPDFDVQDEVMTQRRMQERWRRYLEGLGKDAGARRAVDRLLSLGLKTNELEGLALGLASRGEMAEIFNDHPLTAEEPAWPDLKELREQISATGFETDMADSFLVCFSEGDFGGTAISSQRTSTGCWSCRSSFRRRGGAAGY